MGHPASDPGLVDRVETLDQRHLARRLRVLEVPPVGRVRLDGEGLALAVRVDQLGGDEVGLGDRLGVGVPQRVSVDGLDGAPDVDDLETLLGELLGLVGEVVLDPVERGSVRLVDVDLLGRAAAPGVPVGRAANGVVEDEDAAGSGSISPVRVSVGIAVYPILLT